ncbi:hypothetical protein OG365_40155 (plasmid) [Streptomyces sp. NBC_00853]|uniref:hypothetical protein n=1 Tax=Streptomyces sp. NBC_00853 TaxID=2903681 RepID=UPI002F9180C2|nr:hypothetical protein OG365_40155 [Streptomyces sp. NBC_00853]
MNRKEVASLLAACALSIAVLQAAGTATAAPSREGSCGTWISGPGQTGNVTCPAGGVGQFRAKVTCTTDGGSTFVMYGLWEYQGVPKGTCSMNGTAGVSYIDWDRRMKG